MWIRRAFLGWTVPAAFLLPLWLFVSWGFSGAGGWAFLWVMFAMPAVFVVQSLLAVLVRMRADVREQRALGWADAAGFALWHALTIALGFYTQPWWAAVFVLAVLTGVGLCWFEGWQWWRRVRRQATVRRTAEGVAYIPPPRPQRPAGAGHPVIVVEENR